ncbi:unnamed protein product, partial [Heligmosomoides polygyrus]|uniref:ShKT domain-containing protein n=1 Tax=Heligmosomoides polygyrus TaxID=6339 RepID=A0A183G2B4_HELPZ
VRFTPFVPVATACDDLYSASACTALFGVAVIAGGTTDRDAKSVNLLAIQLKQLAISTCPKSCGYCCETGAYDCSNVQFPRVKCSTVTPQQCDDPTWRTILAQDCPNVCGFCLTGGCVDTAIECANDPAVCRQVDMQAFVMANCQRTCGYCPATTTTAGSFKAVSSSSNLIAVHTISVNFRCSTWATNGFCTNSFYTTAQKMQYCAKTCNLC